MHESLSNSNNKNSASTNYESKTTKTLLERTTIEEDESESGATAGDSFHNTNINNNHNTTSFLGDYNDGGMEQDDNKNKNLSTTNNHNNSTNDAMDIDSNDNSNTTNTNEDDDDVVMHDSNNSNNSARKLKKSSSNNGNSTANNGGGNTNAVAKKSKSDAGGNNNNKTGNEKKSDQQQQQNSNSTSTTTTNGKKSTAPAAAASAASDGTAAASSSSNPPPPIMRGTLSYDTDTNRHLIRGMWNFENSSVFPPQRFEWVRTLQKHEDLTTLPQDGEFHGSFSLAYFHTTSKGKQKPRSKVIPESGVKIKFTPVQGSNGNKQEYTVEGRGTNEFGIFRIFGTAQPQGALEGDPTLNIVLRKRYEPAPEQQSHNTKSSSSIVSKKSKKNSSSASNNSSSQQTEQQPNASSAAAPSSSTQQQHQQQQQNSLEAEINAGPLPEPSKSFPTGVVCLRGKLYKEASPDLGIAEVVHRIHGMWSSGLDYLLADPQNVRGLCNRFEYEHKSSVPSKHDAFPVSGRYSGWFDLSNEDGSRTRINERDVTLKFRPNCAGYHNVEGKGSNVFGKYSITGTLTLDNVITIFRHFQPRKLKANKNNNKSNNNSTPSANNNMDAAASTVPSAVTSTSSTATASQLPPQPALQESQASSQQQAPPSQESTTSLARRASTSSIATTANPLQAPATTASLSSAQQQEQPPTQQPAQTDNKLQLEDVVVPSDPSAKPDPIQPPAHATYSAVSRGVLRVNVDGSHSCTGKWAVTREHFTSGQTSNFNFRLESHLAAQAQQLKQQLALSSGEDAAFPLDSAAYKGSFQLKRQGSRNQTIYDQQLVMRFRMNTQGFYNVYGKGKNEIGCFDLLGTMIMSGKSGGQVELYRIYTASAPAPATSTTSTISTKTSTATAPSATGAGPSAAATAHPEVTGPDIGAKGVAAGPAASLGGGSSHSVPPPPGGMQRRESTRMVKLPSRLEDDDPTAQLSRIMEKCTQILRIIREKDIELGGFFSEPVDPDALGIPTYYQVIAEPMDLKTVQRRLENGEVSTPEEFVRLVRLVFENAIKFNVDPAHSVHQAARTMLVLFNQKWRDVDRMVVQWRRTQGADAEKKKLKDEKKRKRQPSDGSVAASEPISLKRRRLDEAQAMATAQSNAMSALIAAAPAHPTTNVTRIEFNMLIQMIQQLQRQMVQTQTILAELTPNEDGTAASVSAAGGTASTSSSTTATNAAAQASAAVVSSSGPTDTNSTSTAPTKKKAPKRKSEPAPAPAPEPVPPPAPAPAPAPPQPTNDDDVPLTYEEQELLTNTIMNDVPPDHMETVIQIIREAAPVGADDDEIDLSIDQLETKIQRKLLRSVSKFIKKKPKPAKRKPKTTAAAASTSNAGNSSSSNAAGTGTASKKKDTNSNNNDKNNSSSTASTKSPTGTSAGKKTKAPSKPKPSADSFFAITNKDDSDSDSDNDAAPAAAASSSNNNKKAAAKGDKKDDGFTLERGLLEADEDYNDDDFDTANWDLGNKKDDNDDNAKEADSNKEDGEEDEDSDGVDSGEGDLWEASRAAAREQLEKNKQQEAIRLAREEQRQKELEEIKDQRLRQQAAQVAELQAKKQEKEEEEARQREQKERDEEKAKEAMRAKVRATLGTVEQTVDLDEQRKLMEEIEQDYTNDASFGGSSPGSDFGF